jgi:ABC-type multidrug transport system ATPase subunit
MIKVQRLGKRWGARTVFRQLDFTWDNPDIICITGANGSGKTTLLSMLAGVMPPDIGDVLVQGRSLVDQHHGAVQLISYVPDNCPIYPFITGREWLAFTKSIRAFEPNIEQALLSGFGLEPHLDCRFGAMSLGTAKKFLLTSALICSTPVLILDEPTNGLDKSSFEVLCSHLDQRKTEGLVVFSCLDQVQQSQLGARPVALSSLERL